MNDYSQPQNCQYGCERGYGNPRRIEPGVKMEAGFGGELSKRGTACGGGLLS
jgi:hypothetical protein